MNDAAPQLNQAYELVESGDQEAALELLSTIQADFENDPDYWWIYAHAVDDPEEGQAALQRVATLKPDYPGVNSLTQQVAQARQAVPASPAQPTSTAASSVSPDTPEASDEFDFDDDEFELETAASETGGGNSRILIGGIIVVALVIGAVLLLSSLGGDGEATPTAVAEATENIEPIVITPEVTSEALATDVVEATEESAVTSSTSIPEAETTEEETEAVTEAVTEASTETPIEVATTDLEATEPVEVTEDTVEATEAVVAEASEAVTEAATTEASEPTPEDELIDLLRTFDLVEEDAITFEETTLGETLVVNFCARPGPAASTAIGDMGLLVAQVFDRFGADVAAVGFGLTDCEAGRVLRIVGVPRQTVQEYGAGDVSFNEFQTLLRPIG